MEFRDAAEFPAYYKLLRWLPLSILLIGGVAMAIGGVLLFGSLEDLNEALRTEGLPWAFYQQPLMPAMVVLFFAFIMTVSAGFQLLVYAWPRMTVYSALRSGFKDDDGLEGWIGSLRRKLVTAFRRGDITLHSDFDPQTFILRGAKRHTPGLLITAFLLIAATVYFALKDLDNYDLFTEDYFLTVDYWSGEPRRYRYEQADRVEISCRESGDDLYLSYTVVIDGAEQVDILDLGALRKKLAALERVDSALRRVGVPFTFPNRSGWFNSDQPGFNASCRRAIAEKFSATDTERIMALLHEDEWRR